MLPLPWIEALAADLIDLEAELRPLLRDLSRRSTAWNERLEAHTRQGRCGRKVTISEHQARAVLRALMPYSLACTSARQPHARMLSALGLFSAQLLTLNDPLADAGAAIRAGLALRQELNGWLAAQRWRQACAAARVRWPGPKAGRKPVAWPEEAPDGRAVRAGRWPSPAAQQDAADALGQSDPGAFVLPLGRARPARWGVAAE